METSRPTGSTVQEAETPVLKEIEERTGKVCTSMLDLEAKVSRIVGYIVGASPQDKDTPKTETSSHFYGSMHSYLEDLELLIRDIDGEIGRL